jgi:hypothetical protein
VRKSYRPGLFHFVRGGAFLYKDGSDNKQGWDWSCWLKVSQKDAITYIQQIIPNCLAQEATIQLTLSEDKYAPCLFIG